MKFIPRIDISRSFLWMSLLIAVLILAPFYTSQAASGIGEITAISIPMRTIEIDGTRYSISAQTELLDVSGETPQAISITDLKIGQEAQYEASGGFIKSLHVFTDTGQPE